MSQDQRSAFRIAMPDGQKRGSLRFDGRKFEVQLLDASATGVALACPLNCTVEIDACCELHTPSGGGQIRIVRKEMFPDGILIGAERIGDLKDSSQGIWGHAKDLVSWPVQAFSGCNLPTRIGDPERGLRLVMVGFAVFCQTKVGAKTTTVQSEPLATPVAERAPSPEELHAALKSIEAALPKIEQQLSASDQRAIRIFAQQRQLLEPEFSRRLRLSPSQESQIERALAPAVVFANDSTNPEFWEAIRRSEMKILKILTPTQVKAWRQQSGT